jgi:cephalosporin hydroxylase
VSNLSYGYDTLAVYWNALEYFEIYWNTFKYMYIPSKDMEAWMNYMQMLLEHIEICVCVCIYIYTHTFIYTVMS